MSEEKQTSGRRVKKKTRFRRALVVLAAVLAVFLVIAAVLIIVFSRAPEPTQKHNPKEPTSQNDPQTPQEPSAPTDPQTPTEPSTPQNPQTPSDPQTPVEPQKTKELKDSFYTFLLLGTNDDYNTDTIMLGAIDTKTLKCNIISIPRDSMIDTPARIKRINGAYGRNGIDGICEEVFDITGIYPQYYCLLNMKSFIKVVDVIGGVQFTVPYDMYHPDAQSEYTIDLKKGTQVLDGAHALQLVRYRGTSSSDFGRIDLQKQFLVATLNKVKKSFTLTKATSIIETIAKSIKTNMSVKDMVWFYTNAVSQMDLNSDMTFYTMPVKATGLYNGQDYVYLDKEKDLELINKTVNPFTTDIEADELNIICLVDEYR